MNSASTEKRTSLAPSRTVSGEGVSHILVIPEWM